MEPAEKLTARTEAKPTDRPSTIGTRGKRLWIYPDVVRGRFTRWRDIAYGGLILLYILVPWLKIGGTPLLQFDLPARRFYIFTVTFVPTDLFLLALFLLISLLFLFLFSALLGRLWCGWACPQTVYLEGVYRKFERWIEGTPRKRRQLDQGERDDNYWTKKVTKHAIFLLFSGVLSVSFVGYFIGGREAFGMIALTGGHPVAFVFALSLTALVYFDFGWFREQFCIFLCPYARLQSVLLDSHSLIVGYDRTRGEPRGPIRHGSELPVQQGDCIDCMRCVQVCPTGIDIRNGLQLECVSCTACIDACDMVMEKVGRPRGLIRYASLSSLAGGKTRITRPRVIVYSAVLLAFSLFLVTKLSSREILEFAVVRPPGVPYLVQQDGLVRNMFQLHVTNTDAVEHVIDFKITGPSGLINIIPGSPYMLAAGERVKAEAFVMMPESLITVEASELEFAVLQNGNPLLTRKAKFLGPVHH